jgi:hypothetical protein
MRFQYATRTAQAAADALADAPKAFEDAACDVSHRLQDLGQRAGDMASQYFDQGRRSLRRSSADLQDLVEEQPIRSTLVALGIGCLLAACFIRR